MQDSVAAEDGRSIGQQITEAISTPEATLSPPGQWPQLVDPRFHTLLRHWAERRQGVLPPRSRIDAVVIRDCLPNVWLFQYLPEKDDFLCTLSGEKVNEAWGHSLMGKRLSEFLPKSMATRLPNLYRRVLQMPALQVSRRRITPVDGVAQSAERLILPLARDDGSPYGVFGMTLYHLGGQDSFEDAMDMQGSITLYDCAQLPLTLP